MKIKVTRKDVLASVIKLINEYREDSVEEYAHLGTLRISKQMISWLYDWLCEEYRKVGMTMPSEEELASLVQGDTIGKLADIAMNHIPGDGEYEEDDEKVDSQKSVKMVAIKYSSRDGVSAESAPQKMDRERFLKMCAEFFDARGTHFNDFEFMSVMCNEVKEETGDVK